MRRLILFVAVLCLAFSSANAIFVDATLQDNRICENNNIYKPGGIVGFAIGGGFFDEPQNIVDYTFGIAIRRAGYSHSDGNVSVSLWELEFRPLIYSVSYRNFELEFSFGLGYIFVANNISDEMQKHLDAEDARGNHSFITDFIESSSVNFGFRFGYRINEQFTVSLVANYQDPTSGWRHEEGHSGHLTVGGLGINFRWILPWLR